MSKLHYVFLIALLGGCAKDLLPPGMLGTCTVTYASTDTFPGLEFCTDYTFTTSSTRDLSSDVSTAAQASCSGLHGVWKSNEACSTTLAVGYCTYSAAQTAASDSYTFIYRQVFGVPFMGSAADLKSLCDAANVAPLTTVWKGL